MSGINLKSKITNKAKSAAWNAGGYRGRAISPKGRSILSTNKTPSRHNTSSLLDAAGVGRKAASNRNSNRETQDIRKTASALKNITSKGAEAGISFIPWVGVPIAQVVFHWRRNLYIILAALLFILAIFMSTSDDSQQNTSGQTNPLQISKTGPAQAKLGQTLQYNITVTYPGSATDAVITDPLPAGTQYVSSTPKATVTNNVVTWDAKNLKMFLSPSIDIVVTLTLKATQNNSDIVNIASVSLTGASLGGAANVGGNVAANHDTCNGKYTLDNPYGNFGDPQCNFTQQALGTLIKQLDSANALTWNCIAEHESSYNPNAYLKASTSGLGAFGLFQMNPKGQGNGVYDAGNVNWPVQTSNAINYRNKVINGSWAYWQTYSEYCS